MTGSLSVKELCMADAKLDDTVSVIKKKMTRFLPRELL